MVDSKTKKIYVVSITDDKTGDAPEFKKLLDEALQNIENSPNVVASEKLHIDADGAYDSNDNFKECEKRNVIQVRKNFSGNAKGSTARKQQGLIQLRNCEINKKNIKIFNDLTDEQKLENKNK